jgi:signal peptidase I
MNDDRATGDQALTNAQGSSSPIGDGDRGGGPATAGGGHGGSLPGSTGPGAEPEPHAAPVVGASAAPSARKRRKSVAWWVELPVLVVLALVLMLVIKTYAIQAFFIPSSSMENTLDIGDKVLVNKLVYHFRSIDRGDVIVFNGDGSWDPAAPANPSNPVASGVDRLGHAIVGLFGISPDQDFIKRVIGVPGDHVACCDASGRITVNGVPLNEKSYLYPGNPPSVVKFSIIVPPGRLWVMGDHRSVSYDSRGHRGDPGGGTIPESQVIGRAFVIMWPPSRAGLLRIPTTFNQPKLAASAMPGSAAAAVPVAVAMVVPVGWLRRRARRRTQRRTLSRMAFRHRTRRRVLRGRRPGRW